MLPHDDDSSLENLLRSVPLREPSLFLDARIQASLAPRRIHRWAIAAIILLAMGIGIRLALPKSHSMAKVILDTPVDHEIKLESAVSTVYDDGVIADANGVAYQQYHRRTVRYILYIDPNTNAQVRVTIPTNQVLIEKLEAF